MLVQADNLTCRHDERLHLEIGFSPNSNWRYPPHPEEICTENFGCFCLEILELQMHENDIFIFPDIFIIPVKYIFACHAPQVFLAACMTHYCVSRNFLRFFPTDKFNEAKPNLGKSCDRFLPRGQKFQKSCMRFQIFKISKVLG